jgi:hypothetical protein
MFKSKSLNSLYFKEQQLVNFKDEVSQPHERLNEIFAKTRNVPMITKTFHAKGMVPKLVTKGNESTVSDFIEKVIKYSELISDKKRLLQTTAFLHFSARFSGNHYNVADWKIATINQAMQATSIIPQLVQS